MHSLTVAVGVARMSRPDHLLLIAVVYLLGVTIAAAHGATLEPVALLGGLCARVSVAARVHYANEYADHETDADHPDALLGRRVVHPPPLAAAHRRRHGRARGRPAARLGPRGRRRLDYMSIC